MAPTGTYNFAGTTWSKWQIALVVGAPVAVGLGYWYLKRQSATAITKKGGDEQTSSAEIVKQESIDATNAAPQTQTKKTKQERKDPTKESLDECQKHKNKGNTLFKEHKYAEAIEEYSKAIEMFPKAKGQPQELAKFYQNRAAAYEQMKEYQKAKEECDRAIELDPLYVKALIRRSKINENLGNLVESLEDVTSACILEGFSTESTLLSADRILKALGRKHAKEEMSKRTTVMPSKHFIKTYLSSFQEDPVLSHKEETEMNGDGGNEADGFLLWAKEKLNEQRYSEVFNKATEEISQGGKNVALAQLLRGTIHLLKGDHQLALTDLENVIETISASDKIRINALIKRASLYMQLEDPNKSMLDFERAAELGPMNADVFHHRGQVRLLMEDLDGAMQDFSKAVQLNKKFPIAVVQKCYTDFRYALSKQDLSKLEDAIDGFQKATKDFDNCTEVFSLYAQVLTEQEKYNAAEEMYNKALEIDPDNATIYVHKAILTLHSSQNLDKAVDLINEAIKIDDKCSFAYETLGTIQVQRANLDKAVELFRKAIPLAKTEMELTHLFALLDAAIAQRVVAQRYNIQIPSGPNNV
ncbi:mitochondrial import receptor subunit TOM70 [Neocloeon triangulifer]|uniref:mitochondrial import receptor subunit TOM70 n=1 Tax=Neocloeon triangulifer TaxID=2078957 RepID=UPI00286F78C3|nr:mitochondrial import receptor subunit TOM70 [Neocloeon triangulifer]